MTDDAAPRLEPAARTRTGQFLQIAKQYWGSGSSKIAWATLVALLVAELGRALIMEWYTEVNKAFFDSMTARDYVAFKAAVSMIVVVAVVSSLTGVASYFAQRVLEINWRRSLTNDLVSRWMRGHVPYRIERDRAVDNADQRIAEDARMFCESALSLGLSTVGMVANFWIFSAILWRNSGTIDIDLGRYGHHEVQGYLFFIAIGWAAVQTGLTHLAGHKIAGITVLQQKAEADYRFALAKARESAEQVALYEGDAVERSRFRQLFEPIRANWYQLLVQNMKLTFVNLSLGLFVSVVPFLASAPKIMSGEMSVGTMMQTSAAFATVLISLSWIALMYPQLVVFSAVIQRLVGLRIAAAADDAPGIEARHATATSITTDRLELAMPDGAPIASLGDVEIRPGERVLVAGPTGSGKSTLLRAIAGLWPFGRGRIVIPAGRRVMMLPQKSYIADGTLKEAIAYPRAADNLDDEACRWALAHCELGHLTDRLHEVHRWAHLLSGGEQQKLAFARALLYRPEILFLDEATSALDEASEARLYQRLCDELPGCTLVSVAHRRTVERFHDRRIEISAARAALAT